MDETRWWKAQSEDLAQAVCDAASELDDVTLGRQQTILDSYCLYGDRSAIIGSGFSALQQDASITRNVIASAVDTVLSEVTQTRPRPMFVTIGGDYLEQERARKLTYYCDAKFQEASARDQGDQATRDAVVAGLGILWPYIDPLRQQVDVERIFPAHFLVDDRNCVGVWPRSYFVRRIMDRWQLSSMYPDHADAIESAPGPDESQWYADSYRTQDTVEVWEAIHLPSGPETGDGRHVTVVPGAVLYDEPYIYRDPPFAFVRAVKPICGFWGESLAQRAEPTQLELNKLLRRTQDSMHLNARPIWWVPRQSGVVVAHLTNDVGTVVQYDGARPPVQYNPQSMPADVYQYIAALEGKIYTQIGASELSAASLKPRGLNSGRALQVYNDVQSRRFIGLERDYEQLFVRLARLTVRLEKQIAEDNPEHEIVYEKKKAATRVRIKWGDIDLDEDSYRVQVFPASAFPTNPAAKIEMLEGMLERGTIDQQAFYELSLDVPDLEAMRNRVVAPLELLHRRFDMMLEDGEYLAPDTYMDLEMGIRECGITLQRAELDGAPAERLELLRRWLGDAKAHLDAAAQAMAPPAPPPMPPGMDPGMMSPEGMGPPMPPGAPPELDPALAGVPDLPPMN